MKADHVITHGNVDQAAHTTIGWSTSVRTPAFLQLTYGGNPPKSGPKFLYTIYKLYTASRNRVMV